MEMGFPITEKQNTNVCAQCPAWYVVHALQHRDEGTKALHTPELQHRETPWGHPELQHPGETELLVAFPVHFSVFANFFYIDRVQLRKNNKHFQLRSLSYSLSGTRKPSTQTSPWLTEADAGAAGTLGTQLVWGWGVGPVSSGAE